MLPMKRFRFEKYPFLEREFQNILIIFFSYTYESFLLYNQPNNFSGGAYGVRIQIQFLFTQYKLKSSSLGCTAAGRGGSGQRVA